MLNFNIRLIMQCLLAAVIVLFMLSLSGYMKTKENHEVVLKKHAETLAKKELEFKENIPSSDKIAEMFSENLVDFQRATEILIGQMGNRQVFITYLPEYKILYNGEEIKSNEELEKIPEIFMQKKLLKKRDGFSIAYQVYKPTLIELGGELGRDKINGLFGTDAERYRMDFYLYEGEYGRMGIKYISIDDMITEEMKGREWAKREVVFGKKIMEGWYYYVDPGRRITYM